MSTHIISAVRHLAQLKGSLKLTALEIAHHSSRSGHARISYGYLAKKTGLHIKTMIRHVHRLVSMGILLKQTVRLTLTRYAVNAYTFLLPESAPLHKRSTPTMRQILPEAKTEEEKSLALRDEIRHQRWALDTLPLPTEGRESLQREIARLEGLLRC